MIHAVLLIVFSDQIDWENPKWPEIIKQDKDQILKTF